MGGGTSSKTTTSSEFPPEFRPLAEGAVRQLLELQKQTPIWAFSEYEPAGTAGIAPMQQFAMDHLIPSTMMTTPGQQGMLNTQAPVNAASQGAADSGRSSNAAQSALDSLRGSGRLGGGSVALPGGQGQDAYAASLPGTQQAPTAFPGLTPDMISNGWPQASRGSVPVISGPGPTMIDPGNPSPEGFFPPPFNNPLRPDMGDPTTFLRMTLTGRERQAFDALLEQGLSAEEAYRRVAGQHARLGEGTAPTPRPTPPPSSPPPHTPDPGSW